MYVCTYGLFLVSHYFKTEISLRLSYHPYAYVTPTRTLETTYWYSWNMVMNFMSLEAATLQNAMSMLGQ